MQNILPPDEIKAVMSETSLKYIEELEKQHAAHGELKVVKAVALAATTSRTYIEWLDDPNMEFEFNRKFQPLDTQEEQSTICPRCCGRGVIIDYSVPESPSEYECSKCNGGGRI
jgi:hypothetical protein